MSIPIFVQFITSYLLLETRVYAIFYFQADIDLSKRAGELSEEEVEKIITIMSNPRQYKIPDWFLNRQKDIKDGKKLNTRQDSIHSLYCYSVSLT